MQKQISSSDLKERQKKLFMKCVLNLLRQYFNDRSIGFHPLIVCVSIKPGSTHRCSSLQSYPNQQVWKALAELPEAQQKEIQSYLFEKLNALSDKFDDSFLIEFQNRAMEGFRFTSFYKDDKVEYNEREGDSNKETPLIVIEGIEEMTKQKRKKWSKGENFVSESRQILQQIKICNQKGSQVEVIKLHYHKLKALAEKMTDQKFQQSQEMKEFIIELQIFCHKNKKFDEEEAPQIRKKVCKSSTVSTSQESEVKQNEGCQQTKIEQDDEVQLLLNNIVKQTQIIEPGIKLFLPNYSKVEKELHHRVKSIEENFYKTLYYIQNTDNTELTKKTILSLWRTYYEPQVDYLIRNKTEMPMTAPFKQEAL